MAEGNQREVERSRATPCDAAELLGDEAATLELSRRLRALARQLVADEASADDLVQEAWLAALDQPTAQVRDLNAWLRRVVANLAARRRRRAGRRREVEALAAAREAVESEARLVEQLSTVELLRHATAELREPYRGVLVQRFFEERSVEEIARQGRRSAATVRSQISRGLEELRAALDRRHAGDRAAWAGLLLQIAREDGEAVAVPTIASTKALIAALLLVVGLPLAFFALRAFIGGAGATDEVELVRAETSAPDPAALAALPGDALPGDALPGDARAPLAGAAVNADVAPAVTATHRLEVQVLRADGGPARAGQVRYWGAPERPLGNARCDASGLAVIEVAADELRGSPDIDGPHPGLSLRARDDDEAWSLQYDVPLPPEGRRVELRTRGPAAELRARVVDESGAPIADAHVVLDAGRRGVRQREGDVHFAERISTYHANVEGDVLIVGLPLGVHHLRVEAPGTTPLLRPIELKGGVHRERLVLRAGRAVTGWIRYPDGSPASGVRVWAPDAKRSAVSGALDEAFTDENGRYELEGLAPGARDLFASDPNVPELFVAGVVEVPEDGGVVWDARLEEAVGVRLRVEDADGAPVRDAFCVVYRLEGDPKWAVLEMTDERGEAFFLHVVDAELGTMVQRSATDPDTASSPSSIRPSEETVVCRLPRAPERTASMRGVLLDADGAPFASASVLGVTGEELFDVAVDPLTGAFLVERCERGPHELAGFVPGLGAWRLAARELSSGEVADLGVLRAPRVARRRLEFIGARAPTPEDPWVLEGGLLHTELPPRAVLLVDARVTEFALIPGTYRLRAADTLANTGTTFEVRAGDNEPLRIDP